MYVYKIVNNTNNKWYIGITKNIEHRWKTHKKCAKMSSKENSTIVLYQAMRKYGVENFTFTVLFSELSEEEAKLKEILLIKEYDTHYILGNGYNMTLGGDLNGQIGAQNGRALLTEDDARNIISKRESLKYTAKEVYTEYTDKITERGFYKLWYGNTWKHLQPEIINSKEKFTSLTDEDVIDIITRRDSGKERQSDVFNSYKDKIKFSGFAGIWSGRGWKRFQPHTVQKSHGRAYLTDEQVRTIRTLKGTKSYKLLGEEYGVPASTISNIINNKTYKNVI